MSEPAHAGSGMANNASARFLKRYRGIKTTALYCFVKAWNQGSVSSRLADGHTFHSVKTTANSKIQLRRMIANITVTPQHLNSVIGNKHRFVGTVHLGKTGFARSILIMIQPLCRLSSELAAYKDVCLRRANDELPRILIIFFISG